MSATEIPRGSDLEAVLTSRAWTELTTLDLRVGEVLTAAVDPRPAARVLVPIDLRGLLVRPGVNDDVERADVRSRALEVAEDDRLPPPFTAADPLAPGVHLHWAMPDGLTRGSAAVDDAHDLALPALPDRWLVVRLGWPGPREVRRPLTAWVVEADRGEVVELASWRGPAAPERTVTAVSGGDPAWAATYDSVRGRFAFHDPLEGTGRSDPPVSYVVVGWYADGASDPLHPDAGPFEERLDELGWVVGLGEEAAATALAAARSQRVRDAQRHAGGSSSTVGSASGRPTRTVYHAVLHDVRLDASPADLDGRPAATAVRVAAGSSVSEALARRLSGGHPQQERLLTALEIGALERLAEPDGPADVDQALHQHPFGSRVDPASLTDRVRDAPVTERLQAAGSRGTAPATGGSGRATDRSTRVGAEPAARTPGTAGAEHLVREDHLRHVEVGKVTIAFSERLAGLFGDEATVPARRAAFAPGQLREVRRPAPRWFHPTDPALVLAGLGRSRRHGDDGRFEPSGKLRCRLSDEPISGYAGLVEGHEVVVALGHGGLPRECDQLVREAALTDPEGLEQLARAALASRSSRLDSGAVRRTFLGELVLLRYLLARSGDASRLLGGSRFVGVPPSPAAVVPWRQPWVPLHLEWEAEVALADRANGWQLGELDLERARTDDPAEAVQPRTLRGRSLLTAASARALASAIRDALEAERRAVEAGRGRLTSKESQELTDLAADAEAADLLAGGLAGLHDALLGYDRDVAFDDGPGQEATVTPAQLPQLLRAGRVQLTRLRVVDAFGQVLDLDDELDGLERSSTYEPASAPGPTLRLTPRITAESRLAFRFLDAADDGVEATVDDGTDLEDGNPIAGWLLPDNADDALELFDTTGRPLGQLRATRQGVAWEGTPGDDRSFGDGPVPEVGGPHLARFVAAMLRRDAAERERGAADESPLSALLRTIDTTRWSCDPFGSTGLAHVSELVGRPIAVVRASVELQLSDPASDVAPGVAAARAAAFASFADRSLPLRLGSLARFDDGLLGVFVDDDYRQLRPTHALVKAKARARGPNQGHLDADATTGTGDEDGSSPITSSYIADVAELSVHPGHRRLLTLLVLPGLGVHATCGLVPRKKLELVRSWTAAPLARISPSFRVGPVLLEPGAVRLPRVSALPQQQEFSHRDSPTSWRHDPIQAATSAARLPDRPATIHEGWIRARPEGR